MVIEITKKYLIINCQISDIVSFILHILAQEKPSDIESYY